MRGVKRSALTLSLKQHNLTPLPFNAFCAFCKRANRAIDYYSSDIQALFRVEHYGGIAVGAQILLGNLLELFGGLGAEIGGIAGG